MASKIDGDLIVTGDFAAATMTVPAASVDNASISADAGIERSKLEQNTLKPYPINPMSWRVWDAVGTLLGSAGNDDLGITGGTFATNPVYLTAGALDGLNSTRYARCFIALPAEYDDGETVQIRVVGDMQTAVCSTSCTADLQVYEVTGASETGISADLCATAATSINNLAATTVDFDITATDLVAGDILDVRLAVAFNDGAGGDAPVANILKVILMCDVRG